MWRRIRVRAIRKEEPDLRLYAVALLALARQLQAEDDRRAAEAKARPADEAGEEVSRDRG